MMKKATVISFLCTAFLIGLFVSAALAETISIETGSATENNTDRPNVQQGTMLTGTQTFKVSPELIDTVKTFSDQYYKILKEFETEVNSSLQKFAYNLLASKNLINAYKSEINNCSMQDYSMQECNPQETMQTCEQRLLAKCLESSGNNVSARYSDLNADLIQMKALAEKWGPIFCDQMKSGNTVFNFFGPISCQW
jgi:hypothetical protein